MVLTRTLAAVIYYLGILGIFPVTYLIALGLQLMLMVYGMPTTGIFAVFTAVCVFIWIVATATSLNNLKIRHNL